MQRVLCTNFYGQKVWVSQASAGAFRRHGGFDVPALALIEYLASCFPQAVAFDRSGSAFPNNQPRYLSGG
jgi:hypothetical protein